MKHKKLLIIFFVCTLVGVFPAYKFLSGEAKKTKAVSEKKIAQEKEKQNEEGLRELKKNAKGPILSAIIGLAEKITKKIQRDLKVSDITKALNIPEGEVKEYLDGFVFSTPVVEATPEGLSIEGKITVKGNPLRAFVEVGKGEKGWFGIFYVEAPKKWLLSDYFPDFLPLEKLFPKVNKKIIAKFKKPDLVELSDSFFFISTTDVPNHKKLGDVYRGVGFKGEAVFIGFFDIIDKIFALGGEPLKVDARLKLPSLAGSHFEIAVPTRATIVPEQFKIGKKTVDLIPGFKVTLAPFYFKIRLRDVGLPVLDTSGGIMMHLPFLKQPLELFGGLEFYGNRIKLAAGQRTRLKDFFGIKGLEALGFKAGFNWDVALNVQIAEAGAALAGVGALLGLIPLGFRFEGGLVSGKSDLEVMFDFALHGQRGVDLKAMAKGSLELKDFVQFWMQHIVKKPELTEKVLSKIPPLILQNAKIDVAYSGDVEKGFELSVGKLEIIPGVPISDVKFNVSENGFRVGGYGPRISLGRILQITRKTDPKKGPYIDVACTVSPLDFGISIDGRFFMNLGKLGVVESAAVMDISMTNVMLDSKTELLGFESIFKVTGERDKKGEIDLSSMFLEFEFTDKGRKQLEEKIKEHSESVLAEAKVDLETKEEAAISRLEGKYDGYIKGTKKKIRKKKDEYAALVKKCEGKSYAKKKICQAKTFSKRSKLKIEIEGLKFHKNVTLPAAKKLGKGAIKIGTKLVKSSNDVKKIFAKLSKPIIDAINALAKAVLKIDVVKFRESVEDLEKGLLPHVYIKGRFFGKSFVIDKRLDLSNYFSIAKKALKRIGIIKRKVDLDITGEELSPESAKEFAEKMLEKSGFKRKSGFIREGVELRPAAVKD